MATKDSEFVLIERIRSRDPDAFDQLMQRFLPMIERYVYRLCRSNDITQDVVQETFLRLWERADRFDSEKATLSTWLHRIAHNLCMDHFRKSARLNPLPDDWESEQAESATQTMVNQGSPESALEQDREATLVASALNELPERQRSVLVLSYFQGFSNQDIGAIHDLSVSAVESLLARARRNLTKRLI